LDEKKYKSGNDKSQSGWKVDVKPGGNEKVHSPKSKKANSGNWGIHFWTEKKKEVIVSQEGKQQ